MPIFQKYGIKRRFSFGVGTFSTAEFPRLYSPVPSPSEIPDGIFTSSRSDDLSEVGESIRGIDSPPACTLRRGESNISVAGNFQIHGIFSSYGYNRQIFLRKILL
jgi:hypothetical protein